MSVTSEGNGVQLENFDLTMKIGPWSMNATCVREEYLNARETLVALSDGQVIVLSTIPGDSPRLKHAFLFEDAIQFDRGIQHFAWREAKEGKQMVFAVVDGRNRIRFAVRDDRHKTWHEQKTVMENPIDTTKIERIVFAEEELLRLEMEGGAIHIFRFHDRWFSDPVWIFESHS